MLTLVLGFAGLALHALKEPMVGGTEMYPTKNIVENAGTPRITPRW
jgi:hypothetical protein